MSYPKKRKPGSSTVRIPEYLKAGIEELLLMDAAKERGFRYTQDVVSEAVKKLLEFYGVIPEYRYEP